jgi:hypothetical protein
MTSATIDLALAAEVDGVPLYAPQREAEAMRIIQALASLVAEHPMEHPRELFHGLGLVAVGARACTWLLQHEDQHAAVAIDMGDSLTTKRKRRREPSIPKQLRIEINQHAPMIASEYRELFAADRQLKDRVLRLLRALLPPRPRRRGRPRNQTITSAIVLRRKFRRQYPEDKPRAIWSRIYPLVIPGYADMPEVEQRTAREKLREQVAWRRRKRHPREIPAEISIS